jgi:hypothetical protein
MPGQASEGGVRGWLYGGKCGCTVVVSFIRPWGWRGGDDGGFWCCRRFGFGNSQIVFWKLIWGQRAAEFSAWCADGSGSMLNVSAPTTMMPAGVVTLLGASLWVSTLGDNPRLRGLDCGGAMHCYRLGGVAWSADSTRSRVNVLGGKFGSVFLFVFYSIFFVKCSPLHLVTIWLLRLYRKPISKGTLSVIFDPFCAGIKTKSNTLAGECRHFSGYSLIITIRASPTGRRKRTFFVRLRLCGQKTRSSS